MWTKNISWNWRYAGFGAVMALLALILIIKGEVLTGTSLLIGSIPAAIVGLPPKRKERKAVLVVGLLFSASILVGSILAVWPPLAVVGMFLMSYISVQVAAEKPLGVLALSVIMPLTAIGLTYVGIGESAKIAGLFALSSIGSYIWALVLPEYKGKIVRKGWLTKDQAKQYGLTLGIAAAVSTAVGFALDVQFVGWLVGSTLLVMRPNWDALKLRSAGRAISVFVGATSSALLLLLDPSYVTIAIVLWLVLVMMAATSESRWYTTPIFTSFLILWALLYGESTRNNVAFHFSERVIDTLIGVSIAFVVGAVVPRILARRNAQR